MHGNSQGQIRDFVHKDQEEMSNLGMRRAPSQNDSLVGQLLAHRGWFPLDFVQEEAQAVQLLAPLFPVEFSWANFFPLLCNS